MARLLHPKERDHVRHITEGWTLIDFGIERYDRPGFLADIIDWICQPDVVGYWYPVAGTEQTNKNSRVIFSASDTAMMFKMRFC